MSSSTETERRSEHMGASVVHDGVVTFRFNCRACDVTGSQFDTAEGAHEDGVNHQYTWHQRHGSAHGSGERWFWSCRACNDSDVTPYPVESEAAAFELGWRHELEYHHRDFFIEQLGTGYVDSPADAPGAYDNDLQYCGEPENQSDAPLESTSD
jgi:hypothetical protein